MRDIRKRLGFSIGEFADKLGVNANVIRDVENNNTEPGYSILMKLNESYNINPNYILLGIGEISTEKKQSETQDEFHVMEQGEDVANLVKAMAKSPLLRYAILSFALSYQVDKQYLIEQDMEYQRGESRKNIA